MEIFIVRFVILTFKKCVELGEDFIEGHHIPVSELKEKENVETNVKDMSNGLF